MADQAIYKVDIELSSTNATTFTPFPSKIVAGTSFLLEATVLLNAVAANIAGSTAKLYGRPYKAPNTVPTIELATGTISTNKISFDVDAGMVPSLWGTYTNGTQIWMEVELADVKWIRSAKVTVTDDTFVEDGTATFKQSTVEKVGAFNIESALSGKIVYFDGGEITLPVLPQGVTVIVRNTSNSLSTPWILNGVTIQNPLYTQVQAKGSMSIDYRTTTSVWVDGNLA